jgi:hypothetical protein
MPRLLLTVALVLGLVASTATAGPKGPEKVFAGKVIVSNKRFPTYAKSASAYVSAIKKQSKRDFQENKEDGTWKVYFAAFLNRPLDDLEVLIKLYDVSGSDKSLLATFEQYTDQRGQRTIISDFTLDKKQVGVNKSVIIEVEYKGTRLAAGQFRILGEGEHYSGKVNFSEDEEEDKE